MKTTAYSLLLAILLSSGSTLAYEDRAQWDPRAEAQHLATASMAVREATAPSAPPAGQVQTSQNQDMPDPRMLPYVTGAYEQ